VRKQDRWAGAMAAASRLRSARHKPAIRVVTANGRWGMGPRAGSSRPGLRLDGATFGRYRLIQACTSSSTAARRSPLAVAEPDRVRFHPALEALAERDEPEPLVRFACALTLHAIEVDTELIEAPSTRCARNATPACR
jgi:hypothetical protein